MTKGKDVFLEGGGTKSCGKATNEEEVRELAWEKLPGDIKAVKVKENMKVFEFDTNWVVLGGCVR